MSKIKSLIPPMALLILILAAGSPATHSDQLEQAQTLMNNGQYEQAKNIYQQILAENPGSDEAIEAQKQIVIIHIATDKQDEADAAFEQLIAGFSQHKDIAKAIWQIAKQYDSKGNRKKAIELHQYNVANFSKDRYAMLSQVEIIKSYIIYGSSTTAAVATDELINKFSDQPTLPHEIYQIARAFSQEKQEEKATKLDEYIIEKYPSSIYALLSQAYLSIKNGDLGTADATVDKILNDFPEEPVLSKELFQFARKFEALKKYDKAFQLYQHEVEHFPADDINTMWSLTGIIKCHIRNDNGTAADAAYNKLLSTYSKDPNLPEQIHYVARKYEEHEKYDKAVNIYRYNVESFPAHTFAMRSQVRTIRCHISDGNEADIKASIEKLISLFYNHPDLPREIYKTAEELEVSGYHDMARKLHEYVIDTRSDSTDLDARTYLATSNIASGNEAVAGKIIDSLFVDFKDNSKLPKSIFKIGEQYWNMALAERRKTNPRPSKDIIGNPNNKTKELLIKAQAVWERIIKELPQTQTTAQAYEFIAECDRLLGQYQKAIENYQTIINDWPDYQAASYIQFKIGRTYRNLQRKGAIPESEAELLIKDAYEKLVTNYPDSDLARSALRWLDNYNKTSNKGAEK